LPAATSTRRLALYFASNLAFIVLLAIGYGVGGSSNPRLLYLVLLFALCSLPVIDVDQLNGRLALLAIFMVVYFVSFGFVDLTDVFMGIAREQSQSTLSLTEAIAVTGGAVWVLGYRLAVFVVKSRPATAAPRDWSERTTLIVGLILWSIGTYATYMWSVYIVPDTTNEAVHKGVRAIGTLGASANILGQMMQPLGLLLLAYGLYTFRRAYLLPLVISVVILQVALGFVVDIKGMAMLGGILVIVTCIMVTGRVPKAWLAAALLFVIFVFPIFTAYRTAIHGDLGLARTAVIANFGKVLQMSIAAEDRVNKGRERAQTFFERASVKGSLETIVQGVGKGVEFQHGHTLTPILSAFVPRIVWSDKPDVPTGQLVNKEFHLNGSEDVYISPSHLGDLYWNFGWAGVIAGMGIIGLICGYIGARCDMTEVATVTRLLILVLTIKQLIVSFEGALGSTYVVWLRSLAAIGVLHLLFARVPVRTRSSVHSESGTAGPKVARSDRGNLYPNLLG
jgi:hypothetical protein